MKSDNSTIDNVDKTIDLFNFQPLESIQQRYILIHIINNSTFMKFSTAIIY